MIGYSRLSRLQCNSASAHVDARASFTSSKPYEVMRSSIRLQNTARVTASAEDIDLNINFCWTLDPIVVINSVLINELINRQKLHIAQWSCPPQP